MKRHYDFIVLGSGIAGLSFALQAARHGSVAVLTKKNSAESNTNYAQGGIASVVSPEDDLESHVKDTLEAGAGLCHENTVRRVVSEGPHVVQELIEFGVEFSRTTVPLRLITSAIEGLESRAQARRVCARLGEFRRAEIDFGGVASVGHAFADELFNRRVLPPQ